MEEMHVRSMSWVVWGLECCMSRESLNVKGPQGLSFHWGHIIGQTTETATSLRPPPNCWAPATPGGLPLGLLFGALLSELCIHLYLPFLNHTAFVTWRRNWKFLLPLSPWWERSPFLSQVKERVHCGGLHVLMKSTRVYIMFLSILLIWSSLKEMPMPRQGWPGMTLELWVMCSVTCCRLHFRISTNARGMTLRSSILVLGVCGGGCSCLFILREHIFSLSSSHHFRLEKEIGPCI